MKYRKWPEIAALLKASCGAVFTDGEFRAVAKASAPTAKEMLIRYTRNGLLIRLKRGLYAVAGREPSPWFIANRLYKPSYISLNSALSYHGLIPESVFTLTSVTAKPTREIEADGRAYSYRTVKKCAFTGYRGVEMSGETVLMAEKEKALADHLYFVFLKRDSLNERLSLEGVGRRKLAASIKAFNNPGFLDWFRHDFKVPDRRTAR